MPMAVGLPQFHSDNHWIKWERRWSTMKSNNPQLAEMFSDYVKTRKYVDSGWKSIAGNILAFIKNEPVTEPGLLTEYVVKNQGDKARARDIILDFLIITNRKQAKP